MKSRHLLSGVAVTALYLGLTSTSVLAFDSTNWTWDLSRTDTKTSTSTSSLTAAPTGDMTVESKQIYLGNVNADADGTAIVAPSATAVPPLDGTAELGHVEVGAAGYANVYSGASEVPLTANIGQFHVGGVDPAAVAAPGAIAPTATNGGHAYADKLIGDVASGVLTPHETTASARAVGVTNATASAESRAVSNSISLELAAPRAEPLVTDPVLGVDPSAGFVTNGLMTSDTTQLSIGNVTGQAVSGVEISGYGNLGAIDRPLSSAKTTAIGNLNTSTTRIGPLASPQ
ncbi:MAG TPA: hypothetical protein VNT30_09990 [Stellaceae bacterium]|nr:hypothetical protein [Stellaceae bacterium]